LPDLKPGLHSLLLTQSIRRDSSREWCYLLGDFGVYVDEAGLIARLIAPPSYVAPADQVRQGLPFYAGNASLEFCVELAEAGRYRLDIGEYHAPLVAVAVDSRRAGCAAFPPYAVDLGWLQPGSHVIEVTVFGSRANAFGPLHLSDRQARWLGPAAYRTRGSEWSDAWQLRPQGLSAPPRLMIDRRACDARQ
jgi:hypothetical protein